MVDVSLRLRKALPEDVELLFVWANDPEVRKNSFNTTTIQYPAHAVWYEKQMHDQNVQIYIGMVGLKPVGQVRVVIDVNIAEINYSVAPGCRGGGIGYSLLLYLEEIVQRDFPRVNLLRGYVKPDNIASRKIFTKLNYFESSFLKNANTVYMYEKRLMKNTQLEESK